MERRSVNHDDYIDEALTEAAKRVPEALATIAARDVCEDIQDDVLWQQQPCVDCLSAARLILAYVYAFEPRAVGSDRRHRRVPCVACFHTRWDDGEPGECVFHKGMDHWITRNWLPPIEPRRWWHRLRRSNVNV